MYLYAPSEYQSFILFYCSLSSTSLISTSVTFVLVVTIVTTTYYRNSNCVFRTPYCFRVSHLRPTNNASPVTFQ